MRATWRLSLIALNRQPAQHRPPPSTQLRSILLCFNRLKSRPQAWKPGNSPTIPRSILSPRAIHSRLPDVGGLCASFQTTLTSNTSEDVVIGPGNANIVSVVHVVSLIITIVTMSGLFVMLDRLTTGRKARTEARLNGNHLKSKYNPPFHPQDIKTPAPTHPAGCPGQEMTAAEKAKRITACSDMLRQRYDAQIQIWSCHDEYERGKLQRKSDAMHNEIWTTVWRWKHLDRAAWTEEGTSVIEERSRGALSSAQ